MDYRSIIKLIVLPAMLTVGFTNVSYAQYVETTKNNDKSKTEQIKSMETGHWNFHPGIYYMVLHNNGYSGGSWSGLHINFSERKSKVGWVSTQRSLEVAAEALANNRVQLQIDSIKPLVNEERLRHIERVTDLAYANYSSELNDNFDFIDSLIERLELRSKGNMPDDIAQIKDGKELLKEQVKYIHKDITNSLSGNEMEETKRALAYEEVLRQQKELINRGAVLLRYALAYYNK